MKQELISDLISQKNLLVEINAMLKKQTGELATNTNKFQYDISEKNKIIEELRDDKKILLQIVKKVPSERKNYKSIVIITALVFSFSLFIAHISNDLPYNHGTNSNSLKTEYLIQNLKGDKIATWKSWHVADGRILMVNIVNAGDYPQSKIDAIKDAILDEQTIKINNSLLGKEPADASSTYFLGWQGALKYASQTATQFYIPTKFNIIESPTGEGDITITLSNLENEDEYTGYTKSDTDGNQILKSSITIFNADHLSPQQLGAITRHEFGHAMGLAHSTATEDLMHATIQTDYPFISECDIDAIKSLYDGSQSSQVVCKT